MARNEAGNHWHTSIESKDWTLLQKYLGQVASPQSPHLMSDASNSRNKHATTSQQNATNHHQDHHSQQNHKFTSPGPAGKKKPRRSFKNWIKKKTGGKPKDKNNSTVEDNGSSIFDQNNNIYDNFGGPLSQEPTDILPPLDKKSLLVTNSAGRTPLQVALNTPEIPDVILHKILRAQPRAVTRADAKGRLPLHFAIVRRRPMVTVRALVELYPEGMYHKDAKGKTPVAYALDVAKQMTDLSKAPPHFWAKAVSPESPEGIWQASQIEQWEMVRWCLEYAAAYLPRQQIHRHYDYEVKPEDEQSPESFLIQENSANNTQPYLIQAMLHAAPPSVVSLLLEASKSLFQIPASSKSSTIDEYDSSDDEDYAESAISLGCSAFYLAVFRQYPLPILQQLGSLLSFSNAVREVRDETGLGLVSAHYVTSCFEKSKLMEYVAAEDFMVTVEQCIMEGALPRDNLPFLEWWDKLKYLIFFAADKNPMDTSVDYLLHAALENADTPPNIIRLLLALYPNSARQSDEHSAHPLHLFAMHRDYVPRNYESPYMHGLNAMDMLLSLDESAAFHIYQSRLPLHHAIAAGRTWDTLHPLLSSYRSSLRIPDPITKLYAPLLAAAYIEEMDDEEEMIRILQLTRNQYSAIVWQGLSEKKKKRAIQRIQHFESLKRLTTIFELLSRFPQAIQGAVPKPKPQKTIKHDDIVVEATATITRRQSVSGHGSKDIEEAGATVPAAAGPEMIAFHYLSWCYRKASDRWHMVDKNMETLHAIIDVATEHGVLSQKDKDFVNWWGMLKLYFWKCYNAQSPDEKIDVPRDDNFLLHVAVSIPTTPPDVVQLLLGLFPHSASLAVPNTETTYPLHLACKTTTYTPQYFEKPNQLSTLDLVLHAFPEAVHVKSHNNQWPLHIAILAGKTLSEVGSLIQQGPSFVNTKDSITGLYPFQLMTMSKKPSHDLRLRFQTLASNRHAEGWNQLTARRKIREIRTVESEYQKRVFTSTFELLRLKPTVLSLSHEVGQIEVSRNIEAAEKLKLAGMTFADINSDHEKATRRRSLRRNISGLSRLSRDASTASLGAKSVFSTIDIMSAISNVSSHLNMRSKHSQSRQRTVEVDASDIESPDLIDDYSEDSEIWSEDISFHERPENQHENRAPEGQNLLSTNKATAQTSSPEQKNKMRQQVLAAAIAIGEPRKENVPTVVMEPITTEEDDVSYLDGINSKSISSGRHSLLQNGSLGSSSISDSDSGSESDSDSDTNSGSGNSTGISEMESSSYSCTDSDRAAISGDETIQSAERSFSESESIQSVEDAPGAKGAPNGTEKPIANHVAGGNLSARRQRHPGWKKEISRTDRVTNTRSGSGVPIEERNSWNSIKSDDRIQNEIDDVNAVPQEKEQHYESPQHPNLNLKQQPLEEEQRDGDAVVFRLRRSSCQRQGGSGPVRMAKQGRNSSGDSQGNSSSDMDFLSILNASLPEGKMDYLSTLEISASTLKPNSEIISSGLDASHRSEVNRMDQIVEFPSESSHVRTADAASQSASKETMKDGSCSRSSRFNESVNESAMHLSQATILRSGATRNSPSTPHGSIRQSLRASMSPGASRSSREILPATCNYIGVKPDKLKSCLHCGQRDREMISLPCQHKFLCKVCSEEADFTSCLMCFGPVTEHRVAADD